MSSPVGGPYVIGCDVGSQGTNAALYGADGTLVASVYEGYDLAFPHPGWAEQDPSVWSKALMSTIGQLVAGLDALGLPNALTGPLARGDVGTIAKHLAALEECAPEMAHLYRHLARLTLPLAQEKGKLDDLAVNQLRRVLE